MGNSERGGIGGNEFESSPMHNEENPRYLLRFISNMVDFLRCFSTSVALFSRLLDVGECLSSC